MTACGCDIICDYYSILMNWAVSSHTSSQRTTSPHGVEGGEGQRREEGGREGCQALTNKWGRSGSDQGEVVTTEKTNV